MQLSEIVCLLVATLWLTEGFVLNTDSPMGKRNVTKTLKVDNGGKWGTWDYYYYHDGGYSYGPQFCEPGTYAVGYNMKIEPYQLGGDDTELNGIALQCETLTGRKSDVNVTSAEGNFGDWFPDVTSCDKQGGLSHFLTSFALQTEEEQPPGTDDTAANYIKFHCRDFDATETQFELARPPGHGGFGSYGDWSDSCDPGSAICGLYTKVEYAQGEGDDTALNDVMMYCCT